MKYSYLFCSLPIKEMYYYNTCLAYLLILIAQSCTYFISVSVSVTSNITDLHSLLAFKASIEFDPDNILANNWTSDTNFCHWFGVTCSRRRQRVTRLNLPNLGLKGPISPQVKNLSFLTILNLTNNGFHGQVIQELGYLSRLKYLNLKSNNLKGEIPITLSLCRKLQFVGINRNGMSGTLPKNLTTLPRLRFLYLGRNKLTGRVPDSFVNMSTLQVLSLELNQFHGTIPSELGFLPRLTALSFGINYLSGRIPTSLFNISSLETLALASNSFTGDLPKDTAYQLPNLNQLEIGANQLTGTIPSHLCNASKLTLLTIEYNNFTGTLPEALPLSLQVLSAHTNKFQGEIPTEIGTLKNLFWLDLQFNRLTGTIPITIKGMKNMQQLFLNNNELEGHIPKEICSLSRLGDLHIQQNRFSGSIPGCIGNLSGLQQLSLATNELSSTIPQSLWTLDQLFFLDLSSNSLHGNLESKFTTMKSLDTLNLSHNKLSGNLPDFSRSFQSLIVLDLSWNSFSGPIPTSFGKLITLVNLNISNNNLSGTIPKSLEALTYLKHLNLSYNNLFGEVPTGGPFLNFTPQSFLENQQLCGEPIFKPCPSQGLKKSRTKLFPLSYIIPIIVVVLIIGTLFYVSRKRSRNNMHQNQEIPLQEERMISYHELSRATNGFSEANLLGSGGFGRVYKGILSDGEVVAVKLLNLTVDGAIKSFDAECKVLRTVRHRNLVKVISTCTNPELRALVLEYIPNGSLEKWLYSHNYCLSFLQRVSIMLDVAAAMDYLHCGQAEPVLHCDLKPSNVLVDDDMVGHVSDFGIAKILAANKTETHTSTLGTFGYISPEYGTEGRVSIKGDAYSFGIMLLETFTRKKPTDAMFTEGLSLRQWVNSLFPDHIVEVFDENLLDSNVEGIFEISLQHNLLAVLDLGLDCSRDSPEERLEMKEVVTKLNKIMSQILSE